MPSSRTCKRGSMPRSKRSPWRMRLISPSSAAPAWRAPKCVPDCVRGSGVGAENWGFPHLDIFWGAGHDAVHLSRVTPTAMIFVPCKDGLSHNEAESATIEHCAAGAQVLLEAALALDAKLPAR